MIANYVLYLNSLPVEKKLKQIAILLALFLILLVICIILKFLKIKFINENKNSLFQRFLKKL